MPAPAHTTTISKNDFLVALCNSIKEGAAIVERSSLKIIFCNKSWYQMFEFEEDADIDLPKIDEYRKVKLSSEQTSHRMAIVERQGYFTEQVEYVSNTGRSFWSELSMRLFRNADNRYFLVVIDRIDDMKESEQLLEQDKQRFLAFFENASMGIIETNTHAEIIYINNFALRLFGYELQEVLNKNIETLIPKRFHSKHVHHRENYIEHPKNRPMGVGMDLYAIKKNGREFPVEVSLSTYSRNGKQYVIAFVSDISIRKASELEVQKLNDELEETVELRTRELKAAVRELERSKEELSKALQNEKELSELKSRFVSMASHEFRTPLSTVLSSAYLLEQYNVGEERSKREKHLKRIISSVNMLTDILNDFLSVGKIEEGKIHVKFSEFNIQKMMDAVIEEMKHNLRKGQMVHYEHQGATSLVLDASLLKHIVMNLISNASKFSPESSFIQIRTIISHNQFVLSVQDQGIGISREDQKHLMERFFRGTNAMNIQGTGLGLHIVSKYAELMRGTITCDSKLQVGTTFITTFNLTPHQL